MLAMLRCWLRFSLCMSYPDWSATNQDVAVILSAYILVDVVINNTTIHNLMITFRVRQTLRSNCRLGLVVS
jgi:hypothetical protein